MLEENNIFQRNEEIKSKLKEAGNLNRKIDHGEFLELYEPYKQEMSEVDFAHVIGMSSNSYYNLKNQGTRVMILKEKVAKERKIEIQEELRKNGNADKTIDYKEFLELYKPYEKEMAKKTFAEIIGISYRYYLKFKRENSKTKILKSKKPELDIKDEIEESRKEEIIAYYKEEGYANKLISYKEFLELYETHKTEMSEKYFASVIGISYLNYSKIKSDRTRTTKMLKFNITEEKKREVINELKQKGYLQKMIDYAELKELYKPYQQEMREQDFAHIIGISYTLYNNMRRTGCSSRILKDETTELKKEEIVNQLKKQQYENQLINYNKFLQIYDAYKNEISEKEFAQLLGITDNNYNNIRYKGSRAKIKFNNISLKRLKYELNEKNRIYTKDELLQKSEQYGIELEELLTNVFGEGRYIESLMKREYIYIGKCEIPKQFREQYGKEISEIAKERAQTITEKYHLKKKAEDFASEVLIYVLENRGDIVINSENDEEALEYIKAPMNTFIKYKCLLAIRTKQGISLDSIHSKVSRKYFKRNNDRCNILKDRKINIEEEVENSVESSKQIDENKIVGRMRECYDRGMSNTEAIKCITERYGISKEELLKILEEELTKRRKVVKTADGKVYLGEEVE